MNRKFLYIFCVLSLVYAECWSQETTISQILTEGLKDEQISLMEQSNSRLGLMKYNLPFLEKIDIRTETNRLLTSRQEFMIRTSFNSFGQKKAERQKFGALLNKKNARTISAKNEVLVTRYFDVVDLVFLKFKQALLVKSKKHLTDKLKISEDMLSNGLSIDLEDYIKIRESILENELKTKSLEADLRTILQKLEIEVDNEIDLTSLPSPQQAKDFINGLNPDFDKHPTISVYDLETQYLNANLMALRAENRRFFDFAQAKYTVREDLLFENRFSVGLGLNIPWRGSFALKHQDIKVKQEDNTTEKEIEKSQLKRDFDYLKVLFDQEFQKYQLWQNMKADTTLASLKNKVISSGKLKPLKILSLNDYDIDAEIKALEHYEELMKLYIRIIKTSGQLYTVPYRNYLHNLRPVLIE